MESDDFFALRDCHPGPLGLLHLLMVPDLLHNDGTVAIQEAQAIDAVIHRVNQCLHVPDRLVVVYIDRGQVLLSAILVLTYTHGVTFDIVCELEDHLVKVRGGPVAEGSQLDTLVEGQLSDLVDRRPLERSTLRLADSRDLLKLRSPGDVQA